MRVTERRRGTALLGAFTSALLVAGGLAFAPAAATAAPSADEGTVEGATLDWGVKQSFRNYIYNFTKFEGRTTLLGNATQPVEKGSYGWSGGTGTAAVDGSTADVSFGAGNGVHFQSHPMEVDGERVYALDMTFTNPHVVVTSPTTGELRLDVQGYEFESMTSVGEPYTLTDAPVAALTLPAPTTDGDTLTWTNAAAKLTAEGSIAFGNFYNADEVLDPVTFSLPVEAPPAPAAKTTTTLTASAATVRDGDSVTLTATVDPKAAGTVQFKDGENALGAAADLADGVATLKQVLPIGEHSLTAEFTPADAAAFEPSTSEPFVVDVRTRDAAVVEVETMTDVNPAGQTVKVTGSGFYPKSPETDATRRPIQGKFGGTYVVFGSFLENWKPSAKAPADNRKVIEQRWGVNAADIETIGGAKAGAFEVKADGTFETTITLKKDSAKALKEGRYGVYTYSGGGAEYAGFETYTPIEFAPANETTVTVAPSAAQAVEGDEVTLTANVTPDVAGTVQFASNGKSLGEAVEVQDAKATLKTDALEVGTAKITAKFTPTNTDGYEASESEETEVTVSAREPISVIVEKKTGINPAGETVKVTGSGFIPKAPVTNGKYPPLAGKFSGVYIVFGSFAEEWESSKGVPSSSRVTLDTKWGVHAEDIEGVGGASAGAVEIKADGTFETTLTLSKNSAKALKDGRYGVYTYPGGGVKYAGFESYTPIEFAPANETAVSIDPSATDVFEGDKVTLTANVTPDVAGTVQFTNNGKPLGEPVDVKDGAAALETTKLSAGTAKVAAEFTPANTDGYAASVSEETEIVVAAAPKLTVNGKPAGALKVKAGDKLSFAVGPFAEGRSFEAEIHSKTVRIPDTFAADSDGTVNIEWTVPEGFTTGAHSLVLTDVESGRAFTFSKAFSVVKAPVTDGGDNGGNGNTGGNTGGNGNTGGTTGGTGTTGAQAGQSNTALANSGDAGMEIAVAIAGMLLLAGALVVVARRRSVGSAE